MRKLIYAFILVCVAGISKVDAQITELKYLLQYNCETNHYDVKIKIMEGSANSVLERVQFNSQLTILVPTGMSFEIVDRYQPIQNHQSYEGTIPNEWSTFSPVLSPEGHSKYDFYSIAPKLAPASFFNNVEEGEKITLFSFAVDGGAEYDDRIRFFDNAIDSKLSMFEGADLRNGYSVGGATNRYKGNLHKNCTVAGIKTIQNNGIKLYPNPTDSELFIETPENTKSIKMIDSAGNQIKEINNPIKGTYSMHVGHLEMGIYFIRIDNGKYLSTQQFSVY
ncbi:MAG: hypothetical protein ACJA1A_000378 [Saprospiraceae bacterium]|jgi:hypothetical protein